MSVATRDEGILVPVTQNRTSALQDPQFTHVREKAQVWLSSIPKPVAGKEMDSVFFNDDRFELMVDTRGYRPEDLRCTISPNSVMVVAQRDEVASGTQRSLSTTRSYQLPQFVVPQQAVCCLSSEGILLVAIPWQK